MTKYVGWIALVIVVALVLIFGKQIVAFFSPSIEGKVCTVNNNPGTIKNGVCVQNAPAEGTACMVGTNAGTIVNGACVINAAAVRIAVVTPRYRGRNIPMNTSNVRTIQNFLNSTNIGLVERQNACATAEDWCAKEYSQTGNTNGFYCKIWKAGCTGLSGNITINFPMVSNGLLGNTISSRQSSGFIPAIPMPGYKLCTSKTFILPTDVDPIKVQNFLTQLNQEFDMVFKQGHNIILKTTLNPNSITPGSVLSFYVYALDCSTDVAKKAIAFFNQLH